MKQNMFCMHCGLGMVSILDSGECGFKITI